MQVKGVYIGWVNEEHGETFGSHPVTTLHIIAWDVYELENGLYLKVRDTKQGNYHYYVFDHKPDMDHVNTKEEQKTRLFKNLNLSIYP